MTDVVTAAISMFAVGAATFTIFAYLAFIWWLDRYEREPIWLVGAAFLWGAFGGTCFGCAVSGPLMDVAIHVFGAEAGGNFGTIVIAPVVEEVTKALIFIPLFFSRHFDNETDGLIYGAATGLGFAALENLVYYTSADNLESLITLAVLRTAFTALVHCISSALIGVAFGFAKHRSGAIGAILVILVGYSLAVFNHGLWNGIATATGFLADDVGAGLFAIGALIVVCAGAFMFLLTQFSLYREHRALARILKNEAALGTIPLAHADVIPYWMRRRRKGWLPPHVNKRTYVRLTTLLAFRIHQAEVARERVRQQVLHDVSDLRARVQALLAGPR